MITSTTIYGTRFKTVLDFIESSLDLEVGLSDLASIAGLSVARLLMPSRKATESLRTVMLSSGASRAQRCSCARAITRLQQLQRKLVSQARAASGSSLHGPLGRRHRLTGWHNGRNRRD